MTRRNKIALGLAAAAVVLAAAWALRPQPVTVELAEVSRGAFEQTISDDGRTRVRDRYVIHSPLAGRVERIRLEEGDRVKQGQVVALLTPTAPAFLDARTARELEARLRVLREVGDVALERQHALAGMAGVDRGHAVVEVERRVAELLRVLAAERVRVGRLPLVEQGLHLVRGRRERRYGQRAGNRACRGRQDSSSFSHSLPRKLSRPNYAATFAPLQPSRANAWRPCDTPRP